MPPNKDVDSGREALGSVESTARSTHLPFAALSSTTLAILGMRAASCLEGAGEDSAQHHPSSSTFPGSTPSW
eukprot:7823146-Alexandrium_andersonii.AAC.1